MCSALPGISWIMHMPVIGGLGQRGSLGHLVGDVEWGSDVTRTPHTNVSVSGIDDSARGPIISLEVARHCWLYSSSSWRGIRRWTNGDQGASVLQRSLRPTCVSCSDTKTGFDLGCSSVSCYIQKRTLHHLVNQHKRINQPDA